MLFFLYICVRSSRVHYEGLFVFVCVCWLVHVMMRVRVRGVASLRGKLRIACLGALCTCICGACVIEQTCVNERRVVYLHLWRVCDRTDVCERAARCVFASVARV